VIIVRKRRKRYRDGESVFCLNCTFRAVIKFPFDVFNSVVVEHNAGCDKIRRDYFIILRKDNLNDRNVGFLINYKLPVVYFASVARLVFKDKAHTAV